MGDHRNAIVAFHRYVGVLKRLVRLAFYLFARRLGADAGLAEIVFADQVRQHLVLRP